jgi:hypothetical protein
MSDSESRDPKSVEAIAPGRSGWSRILRTPLGDALRGDFSGSLDVHAIISGAALSAPVAALIWDVLRRGRLWRSERVDVARELVAHFADGAAAGRTSEQLVADFGDVKSAARLIRQAKRRNRPGWWQTWHFATWACLWLLAITTVGYSVLAARFYLGRPTIAHNYWHEINAARQMPEADRAWPLYRQAAIRMEPSPTFHFDWLNDRPGGENWGAIEESLAANREALDLTRAAAKKPQMGFLVGDPRDIAIGRENKMRSIGLADYPFTADDNAMLLSMLLPNLQVFRELAGWLSLDALRSAAANDGAAAIEDISALVAMSEQIRAPRTMVVDQLVAIAILEMALRQTGRVLVDYPQALSEDQIRDLAHRLAAYRGGNHSIDWTAERMIFQDCLQRLYTDDGSGDGRITPVGIELLDQMADRSTFVNQLVKAGRVSNAAATLAYFLEPGAAALIGSRRENSDFYDDFIQAGVQAHQGHAWQWDLTHPDPGIAMTQAAMESRRDRMRFAPALIFSPSVGHMYKAVERSNQKLDATEVALALALWHKRNGAWPERLEELVPAMLPEVPRDRFDGQPLRYTVRDGRPVVYSVGPDRDDDGGRPLGAKEVGIAETGLGRLSQEQQRSFQSPEFDGDLVLWPPIEPTPESPPDEPPAE